MKTFQTLLLREWLQHGRRWWLIALVPLAFGLLGLSLGHVQVGGDASPVATLLITATVYTALLSGVGWLVAYIQSGGLARRDWQDRSIEFWRSLPVSDAAAVGATVLMNLVLLPLLLMVLAIPSGLLAAAVLVGRGLGWSVLAGLPWTDAVGPLLAGALRMVLGSLLASFWIAPVALLSMAAAAWLKRWGVPMLWVVWGVGGTILAKGYGLPQLLQTAQTFGLRLGSALLPLRDQPAALAAALDGPQPDVTSLPGLLAQDALLRLQELASGWALLALALSVLGFALLVWRRQRG